MTTTDPNPYQPPELEPTSASDAAAIADDSPARQKRRILIWMTVLFAVSGLLSGLFLEDRSLLSVIEIATAIVLAILLVTWCECDRIERQGERWPFFIVLMVLCPGPILMLPIYLFATRGAGGFLATARAAAFFVLLIGASAVGALPRVLIMLIRHLG